MYLKGTIMDEAFYIQLGGVIEAHQNRAFLRDKAKATVKEVDTARKDLAHFGGFEDCGSSYEGYHSEAQGAHKQSVLMKTAAEKNFKAKKLAFVEAFGAPARAALKERLGVEIET